MTWNFIDMKTKNEVWTNKKIQFFQFFQICYSFMIYLKYHNAQTQIYIIPNYRAISEICAL